MKKFILSFILIFIFIQHGFAQNTNQNLSSSGGWDGEPYLAINPLNADNIIAAWMSFRFPIPFSIEIRSSFDGGQTWSASTYLPHFGAGFTSADVSMAFGSANTVYISYIDHHENPDSGGVYVAKSVDGGLTWSQPVMAIDIHESAKLPLDRPWLVSDNSTTPSNGVLYLTSKPAPWIPAPNRPTYKVSLDHGLTWSALRFVDTTGFTSNIIQAPMASPAVGKDGTVYFAYPAIVGLMPVMVLATSNDSGATLRHRVFLSGGTFSTDTNPKQAWHLCTDPSNANNLAFTWTDNRNGDIDIYSIASHDKGQTWGAPVRVNDDAPGNGNMQDMVWNTFSQNRILVSAWRDRRNAPGPGFFQPFDVYAAYSMDGGDTYSANFRVTDVLTPFDSLLSSNGNDFLGLEMGNNIAHFAWGDFRNWDLDIWYSNQDIFALSVPLNREAGTWTLYPSPVDETIFIKAASLTSGNQAYRIVDVFGRTAQSGNLDFIQNREFSLSVKNLAPSLYFIQLDSDPSGSRRILVMH